MKMQDDTNSVVWIPTKITKGLVRCLVKKSISGDAESEAKLKHIMESDENVSEFAKVEFQNEICRRHQKRKLRRGKRKNSKYSSVKFSDLHSSYQIRN